MTKRIAATLMRPLIIGVFLLGLMGVANSSIYAEAPVSEAAVHGLIEELMAAEDPDAAFRELSPAEQEAVIEALTPVRYEAGYMAVDEVPETLNLAAYDDFEHCKPNIYHRSAYGPTGIKVWRYISDTYFCYNGTVLTRDPTFGTRGETWLFWEYVGDTSTSESGGAGDTVHTDYASGHFRLCYSIGPIDITCPINNYPWIRKSSYGTGAISGTGGG